MSLTQGGTTLRTDALALLEELVKPEGQRLLERIAQIDPADRGLAAGTALRRTHHPALVAAAMTQVGLREAARGKFSRADAMWFTREGLEQASSERMAAHHAGRYSGLQVMADLCTGIGGDLAALAVGRRVLAVDRDPLHLRMAKLNATVPRAGDVRTILSDATDVDLGNVEAVFCDPARRQDGRRLNAGSSSPSLSWCFSLVMQVPAIGIKAAPGLPRDRVPPGWETEFVSEGRALKEALLWSPALASSTSRATLLPGGESLLPEQGEDLPCAPPGRFLLDPDPAVTRAGLVQELGRLVGAWQIDPRIAFLSSDRPLRTPFARLLKVDDALPYSLKRLRALLRQRGVGVVTVRKRGSAVDADELNRKLRLEGNRHATVVLTRVSDRPWALICSEPE